jgi:hypothetical protein
VSRVTSRLAIASRVTSRLRRQGRAHLARATRILPGQNNILLPAGAVAVRAARPTTGAALAFLKLFSRAADAALPGGLLLGVLDPADELVARERRNVVPGVECRGAGRQCLAQVCW